MTFSTPLGMEIGWVTESITLSAQSTLQGGSCGQSRRRKITHTHTMLTRNGYAMLVIHCEVCAKDFV